MEHHVHVCANGVQVRLPKFRGDLPLYTPPDRQAWQAQHGVAPYPLEEVREAYLSRARAAVEQDLTSIETPDVNAAQTKLEAVGQRIAADLDLPDTDLVFFDPNGGKFWVYPA